MHIANPLVPLMLKIQHIKCGSNCKFFGLPIIVCHKAQIKMGNRIRVASSALSNLLGLYQRTIIVARNGALIELGDHVCMSGTTIYSYLHIKIGNDVLIGANTKIIDNDMHPVDPEYRLKNCDDKLHTPMKEIVIGNNVFIGCNCLILKGVHIGDNSVIGAGSVVTHDIPADCIAAGNPARIVKKVEKEVRG